MNSESWRPPAPASDLPIGLIGHWLGAWLATLGAVTPMLALGSSGPSLVRWFELMLMRRPPAWATEHEVIFETPIARLRDFSTTRPGGLIPTLVLPPQAGHDSCIVDYSAEQSQMRAILSAGLERAFSLDWRAATQAAADTSIHDYLDVIDRAIDHLGGRANLVGDCQGGWLGAIYAALEPERVNTLTLAGAPIDFHAGEPVIREALRLVAPGGDLSYLEALVEASGGMLAGEHMLAGFITLKPADEISRQLELLLHLSEPSHVARYRAFEDWFKHTQSIPGAFYLWIVRHLFRDNELVRGHLRVGDRVVSLANIDVPVGLLAGAADHITPPDQLFPICDHISTPPELTRKDIASGGHLGLFMGHEALRDHWPPLLRTVLEHSRPRHRPPIASPRRRASSATSGGPA